jgi:hypothetical protein
MEDYEINGAQHVPEKKYTGKDIGCSYKQGQNPFLKYLEETQRKLKEDKIEFYENGIRTLNPISINSGLEYTLITKDNSTGKIKLNRIGNFNRSNFIIFNNPKT